MRTFELVSGKYTKEGVTHTPGFRLETDEDMVAKFPNQWKEITVERVYVEQTPPKAKKKSAPVQVPEEEVTQEGSSAKTSEEGGGEDAPEEDEVTEENPLGVDVTQKFPSAVKADVLVFRDGEEHYVCDSDDPRTPLHESSLKKRDVPVFIKTKIRG